METSTYSRTENPDIILQNISYLLEFSVEQWSATCDVISSDIKGIDVPTARFGNTLKFVSYVCNSVMVSRKYLVIWSLPAVAVAAVVVFFMQTGVLVPVSSAQSPQHADVLKNLELNLTPQQPTYVKGEEDVVFSITLTNKGDKPLTVAVHPGAIFLSVYKDGSLMNQSTWPDPQRQMQTGPDREDVKLNPNESHTWKASIPKEDFASAQLGLYTAKAQIGLDLFGGQAVIEGLLDQLSSNDASFTVVAPPIGNFQWGKIAVMRAPAHTFQNATQRAAFVPIPPALLDENPKLRQALTGADENHDKNAKMAESLSGTGGMGVPLPNAFEVNLTEDELNRLVSAWSGHFVPSSGEGDDMVSENQVIKRNYILLEFEGKYYIATIYTGYIR